MNEPLSLSLPPITQPAASALPSFPTGAQAAPAPQRAPSGGVPGRPLNDPVAQELKVSANKEKERLLSLTPMKAKDSKLCVFRVRDNRRERKPVLTLLASEIEAAKTADDDSLDNFIAEKLPETVDNCLVQCQWYDRTGRPMPDMSTWEIVLGDPEGASPADDPTADDDYKPEFARPTETFPNTTEMPPLPPVPPVPPPPPALDMVPIARALREERNDEQRRGNDTMQLVMALMQGQTAAQAQQQQMMLQLQQQQQRDAQNREDQDRARRAEFRTTLMALVPMVLPMIQSLFGAKGMSPEMTMMMEIFKTQMGAKGTDAMMLENMMKMQGKMAEQTMELQAKGAGAAASMQAQITNMMFENMTKMLKDQMAAAREKPEEKDDDSVWGTIGKLAGPLLAGVMQGQPAQAGPAAPTMEQAPLQQPVAIQQQPVRRVAKRGPPPQAAPQQAQQPPAGRRKNPADYTDSQRIAASLLVVRRMSLGLVDPAAHWDQIAWITHWLPESMLAAIKAQDREQITSLGLEPIMGSADIRQWLEDEENASYLQKCLADVRLFQLVDGKIDQLTPEQRDGAIAEQRALAEKRRRARDLQVAASTTAQLRHENPDQTPPKAPPVEATVVLTDPTAGVTAPKPATEVPPSQN